MHLTTLDKIWNAHKIKSSPDGLDLLFVDRHYLTDLSGTLGLEHLHVARRAIRRPDLSVAIPDHMIETDPHGEAASTLANRRFVNPLRQLAAEASIQHLGRETGRQGIVHVTALEDGLTLPGLLVLCGDSHTTTHGALGALAFGIGSTEVEHVLATQAIWVKKPHQARIRLSGQKSTGVFAKDIALALIGRLGADFGREHALAFDGEAVDRMTIEERATLCNMAVELGARSGYVAPDETTLAYLAKTSAAPTGELWDAAVRAWQGLQPETDARYDKEEVFDVSAFLPQITWGTSVQHGMSIDGTVPEGSEFEKARLYMGVDPGQKMIGTPIQHVFIGSCTNGRIEDLRVAVHIAMKGRVAHGVRAWVVPGSQAVQRQAESEGLDAIFRQAGFHWRKPGCSMCVGVNGDTVPSGERCVSTSNRNFVGRQGPGARTHLASPATAAASALAGCVADPRPFMDNMT
ncbi:MAG: 3-isopropylmalate dehydratase large subunit [Burkholderiaceae bacterium]|nr:3-isopropylmalate dehydratase large subunit [Burkholderiaceae bacterium]